MEANETGPPVSKGVESANGVSSFDLSAFRELETLGSGKFGNATLVERISTGERCVVKNVCFGGAGQPDGGTLRRNVVSMP